ncbi:unnamed protein product [Rhizophagus irregularis]|nr:unnamed protein product [Rhizophagus irregularis]CAB4441653.1 unnamed protein product [Rhizophagus irregularis]
MASDSWKLLTAEEDKANGKVVTRLIENYNKARKTRKTGIVDESDLVDKNDPVEETTTDSPIVLPTY